MKTLTDSDALLIAAHLLDTYQRRAAGGRREIVCSGQKAYDGSMRDLVGLIVKLHPELRVNLHRDHLPEGVR